MATENVQLRESFPANADLSAKQYYCVKLATGAKVDVCSAATDYAIGVLQNKPAAANRAAEVAFAGITKAVSDGSGTAIACGDKVGANSSGKIVQKATADYGVIGIALDPSAADGSIIRVMLGAPATAWRSLAG